MATAGSAGSQGFVQIILQWFNLATDVSPVNEVIWYVPANIAGALTVGNGPNAGNFLAVQAAAVEVATTPATVLTQFRLPGHSGPRITTTGIRRRSRRKAPLAQLGPRVHVGAGRGIGGQRGRAGHLATVLFPTGRESTFARGKPLS